MSIMKITVYKDGEITREFPVVSFSKGLKAALHLLHVKIDKLVLQDADIVITTCHLSSNEWSACIERADDEVWGVHVGRTT